MLPAQLLFYRLLMHCCTAVLLYCCTAAGYRAAGDAALLQQLCGAAGLPVQVVELVGAAEPGAVGAVSSSKVCRWLLLLLLLWFDE
jgi:hypothetical protein